jgi:hypothetical protein
MGGQMKVHFQLRGTNHSTEDALNGAGVHVATANVVSVED